jgi:oxygen-dependent protoporphyrinogen oxidase
MQTQQYDVVILGAGLTGLSLAHYLKDSNLETLVLEKKNRPGGVINTHQEDGFTYEEGPNTGIVKYGEVAELFEDLQPWCQPYVPDDSVKRRYIWKKDRWEELPAGLMAGIKTPLFSWKDKLRILGEPFRQPGKDPEETLDRMVKRRLGRSFLNYAVDPFILGVYAGDPSAIVPSYALPRLYNLEQNYGSFIGGAVKKKFEDKTPLEKKATKDVFSMNGGLYNLVEAIYNSAGEERFRLGVENTKVWATDTGYEVGYQHGGSEHHVKARYVVSTVGAWELPGIFHFLSEEELHHLSNLKYAKVIQAAVGFRQWRGPELMGFGGLVPHIESRDILGALFMSAFLPGRAPDGGALLSVFMGGIRREDIYHLPDEQVKEVLEREIKDMFSLPAFDPSLLKITRYEHAIPQYGRESRQRFQTIRQVENQYKGLIIAGNLRDGIGMADRIKQAADIASAIRAGQ